MALSVGFDSAEYRRQFAFKGNTHVCRGLVGVELMDWAFENNGCVKYFHTDSDSRLIGERDVLFTFGERGEKIAKSLKKLGKTFTHKETGKKIQ